VACLMAKAPVQVQRTCSRSCNACIARDEAAACCQPHGHAVPRFMGRPWPPAPTTHVGAGATRLPSSCSPMGASIPGVLALGGLCYGQGCGTRVFLWLGVGDYSTADSAHCRQASILAVWLGCMRKFVAA